jgi:hypothetical protein
VLSTVEVRRSMPATFNFVEGFAVLSLMAAPFEDLTALYCINA